MMTFIPRPLVMPARPPPRSCDTFAYVVANVGTVFGKNADRPSEEAHEVLYVPAAAHPDGAMLKCTHISIPQVKHTHAVVLSKPSWMWGCEIGANEKGVVGGNEAVSSVLSSELGTEARLLGMDLLRLALERGATASEAVDVLCALLEEHGQGGACEDGGDWTYENGFLLADASEAYVVETCGIRHWAVERVPPGKGRNISNGLSIREATRCSSGLKELCQANGWWDGTGVFDWKAAVGAGGRRSHASLDLHGREKAGAQHVADASSKFADGSLSPNDGAGILRWMANVLRDEDSGICFRDTHGFMSTGSQCSWLPLATSDAGTDGGKGLASHLFTAASDPVVACYKRFDFSQMAPTQSPAARVSTDSRSLELWQRWRTIDLQGGISRCASSAAAAKKLEEGMRALEEDGLQGVAPDGRAQKSFASAIEQELELLQAALN